MKVHRPAIVDGTAGEARSHAYGAALRLGSLALGKVAPEHREATLERAEANLRAALALVEEMRRRL